MEVLPRLEELLAGLRIGVLHGKLHPDEKDAVMRRFTAGDVDVLLATTVIEVGVDVPNATVMVIMDADRFGVSQLHQLRGRVGRGSLHGLCLLVTDAAPGGKARERLDAVASTTDGFRLSRLDLEQRREATSSAPRRRAARPACASSPSSGTRTSSATPARRRPPSSTRIRTSPATPASPPCWPPSWTTSVPTSWRRPRAPDILYLLS